MRHLRVPLTFWLVSLSLAAAATSAWLLRYFLEPRRWFLSHTGLTTLGDQLGAAFTANLKVLQRLFLVSPWLAALLAASGVLLIWRLARGSRTAALLGAASVLVVPAVYVLGIAVLRRLEDRIYFDHSPWVVQFRAGCVVLAVAAAIAVGWAALLQRAHRSHARPVPL